MLCDIIPDWTISEDGMRVIECKEHTTYIEIRKLLGTRFGKFTTMNDVDGKTFAEIADYVEQNIIAE